MLEELNLIKFEEKLLQGEIKKQEIMIEELHNEIGQKKKALAYDINTAKNEAGMMLQSHGIFAGNLQQQSD